MAHLESTKSGIGAVWDQSAGERTQLGEEISLEKAERLAQLVDSVYVVEDESDSSGTDTPEETEEATSEEEYLCGVNGCSRKVDNPEDTCWQHE